MTLQISKLHVDSSWICICRICPISFWCNLCSTVFLSDRCRGIEFSRENYNMANFPLVITQISILIRSDQFAIFARVFCPRKGLLEWHASVSVKIHPFVFFFPSFFCPFHHLLSYLFPTFALPPQPLPVKYSFPMLCYNRVYNSKLIRFIINGHDRSHSPY